MSGVTRRNASLPVLFGQEALRKAAAAIPTELKNKYFLVTRDAAATEWFPPQWAEPMPRDCIYFGLAFIEMERQSQVDGLRIYVTYDWSSLPEYGESVVVLLLGEEIGRVPRYIRHVRAVFKTMRMRPYLGIRRWKMDTTRLALLIKAFRDWPGYWKSSYAATHTPENWPPRVRRAITYLDVPLGYLNLETLPQKSMADRPFHCFFAGQLLAPRKAGLLGWLPLPKNASRKAMYAAVRELEQHRVDFRFDGSAETEQSRSTGSGSLRSDEFLWEQAGREPGKPGQAGDAYRNYSQRMMDAKFCLAPRGNVVDTFRFFEGMRSGCIVVCEALPNERYYADAPVIQIDDWGDLAAKLEPLLEDKIALDSMRRKVLDWWEQRCCEAATGVAMAKFLDRCGRQSQSSKSSAPGYFVPRLSMRSGSHAAMRP